MNGKDSSDRLIRWLVVLCGIGLPTLFATGLAWQALAAAGWTAAGVILMSVMGLALLVGAGGLAALLADRHSLERGWLRWATPRYIRQRLRSSASTVGMIR